MSGLGRDLGREMGVNGDQESSSGRFFWIIWWPRNADTMHVSQISLEAVKLRPEVQSLVLRLCCIFISVNL